MRPRQQITTISTRGSSKDEKTFGTIESLEYAPNHSGSDSDNNNNNYERQSLPRYTSDVIDSSESNYQEEDVPVAVIGAKETRRVAISRILMIGVFFLAGAGLGLGTWFYTTGIEQKKFEAAFRGVAEEVIQVSQINANNHLDSLQILSNLVTSYAVGKNATWPFVTHPNWPAVASTVTESLGARFVATVMFLEPELRETWENYTVREQGWIQDAIDFIGDNYTAWPIIPHLFEFDPTQENPFLLENKALDPEYPFYLPLWQTTLVENPPFINFNSWNSPNFARSAKSVIETKGIIVSQPVGEWQYNPDAVLSIPEALICQPIYDGFEADSKMVGILDAYIQLRPFDGILSEEGSDGIVTVLSNKCAQPQDFTWEIYGQDTVYLGYGDLHSEEYSQYGIHADATALKTTPDCPYTISVYPSEEFENQFHTSDPIFYTMITILIFVVTALFFFLYDFLVEKRQGEVMHTAQKSRAIVDSIFPAAIRDRLMQDDQNNSSKDIFGFPIIGGACGEKDDNARKGNPIVYKSKPIADYYPVGTVLVADLVNFSAWSSVREPAQVFTLLESLYSAFDSIAKKRKVYKVETHGDCYVACTNIPDPKEDHALAMVRFARDCRIRSRTVFHQLEILLGPDTSTLRMRFAIHTGPVTAGVLRGERSRFQLFGATIDHCFILEKNCESDEIILSQATADLIKNNGLSSLMTPRKDPVIVKGREIPCFWLDYKYRASHSTHGSGTRECAQSTVSDDDTSSAQTFGSENSSSQMERLVEWNVDVLSRLLKMILAMRKDPNTRSSIETTETRSDFDSGFLVPKKDTLLTESSTVLDEVKEVITLRSDEAKYMRDPSKIQLSPEVEEQLKDFVSAIADLYHPNDFHNFQHACHVTQAVTKLLSRVVTPETIDTSTMTYKQKGEASDLHQFTYGITSDPLIQFSCALSALIHDVDHPGVPNAQLVKEKTRHAFLYKNKSVAEQNSVDLAWNILMQENFADLRSCIYINQEECDRFRQLVVNSVMATDIVDKELGQLRKNRWNKAFNVGEEEHKSASADSSLEKVHRKATIVIEHLVQAADVSHMMQHWHIYIKWNEKFFRECYKAFLAGRAEKDPSIGWYQGELGFFDFYVIPLAKKLESCGVFGVSSDEFLQYAEANRREWEAKGEEMVAKYLEFFQKETRN